MARFTIDPDSRNGFTLAEILVALSVGGIVVALTATLLVQIYKEKSRAEFVLALSELRSSFQMSVLRTQEWALSEAGDSMTSCFTGATPSSCLALVGMSARDVKSYIGTTLFYDSTSPTAAFTTNGAACAPYGSSRNCNLKPHLTWRAMCNLTVDPTCLSPLILVELNYVYLGSEFQSIKLASYGFRIAKAKFGIVAANSCTGGVPVCTSSQAAVCESGTWVCREFGL